MREHLMHYGIVYIFTNLVNGKQYIGQTTSSDPDKYCMTHFNNAVVDNRKQRVFYKALRKYGRENFTYNIVFCAFDKSSLDWAEDYFIIELNTLSPNGYNTKRGGAQGKYSEDGKRALSEACLVTEVRVRKKAAMCEVWKREEHRQKIAVVNADPHVKFKKNASRQEVINRPGFRESVRQRTQAQFSIPGARERASEVTTTLFADPDYRARHKAAHNTPEYREKMHDILIKTGQQRGQILSTMRWITDGVVNKRLKPDELLHDGWSYGRVKSKALLRSLAKARAARAARRIQ